MDVIHRVQRTIRRHALAGPDTRLVAAVSGGSDSVALAHILAELSRLRGLRLVGLAHFNHQLRQSADRDERCARGAADALGVPFVADREDVAARAGREGRSIENAARTARYAFFDRVRASLDADEVALGHTMDDQAETVLLRLVRGAGPRGLAGMGPRRGPIVRPLLDCRRAELRAWLVARGIAWVEDETNADVSVPRNRVRAELLPLLAGRFNPNIVEALSDQAELAREVWAWMEEALATTLAAEEGLGGGIVEGTPSEIVVDRLRPLPPALRRLVVWRAMTDLSVGRTIGFDHVRAVLRLTERQDGAADVPGLHVQRTGGRIVLTKRGGQRRGHQPSAANLFSHPLSIPGEVALPGCVVSAEAVSAKQEPEGLTAGAAVGKGPVAVVRGDLASGSLVVRNRRPGDRFHPVGFDGTKKLQDLFVDGKVARGERDAVPLVVDADDRIVWVAGFGIDEAFRVRDASQGMLVLRLRPV